uniref:Uncharacterized protein n=1 Tax=Lactuca sativa TaxID=4236 RepID=A0A9R1UU32_LACSA|nr:hypothetical protein LSAT_V11C800437150 [Lactuca sativa]
MGVALSHVNYNVRVAASDALVVVLDEYPYTLQESLATLFSLYIHDSVVGEDMIDFGWLGRQGIALALHVAVDVLRTKDLPVAMTFLISRAFADTNADVQGRMINVGIMIIDKHGKDNVSLLFPIFENYLNKKVSICCKSKFSLKGRVRVLAMIVKLFSTSNAVAYLTKAFWLFLEMTRILPINKFLEHD